MSRTRILLANIAGGFIAGFLIGVAEIAVKEIRTRMEARQLVSEITQPDAAGTSGE